MANPKRAPRGYCQYCNKRTTRRFKSRLAYYWIYECASCTKGQP